MKNNRESTAGSQLISLKQACEMNRRYRDNKKQILAPDVDTNVLPICETFDRGDFDALLSQDDCVGVRVYLGMKEDLSVCAVIVGVNSANEDIINPDMETGVGLGINIILDNGERCPDECPPPSVLN